jgi:integrase
MAIYKRGGVYWYEFVYNGKRYQRSSGVKNQREARLIEATVKGDLAKGEVGIIERRKVPTLEVFAKDFMAAIRVRSADKPDTVSFYAKKLAQLLKHRPLREARIDSIDEAMIERYVTLRRASVAPATCNRELATLRRALRLAEEWKVITRAPRVRLLNGEGQRDFVLSHSDETKYLSACPPTLRDAASVMLDTGLRIGELLSLRWEDIRFDPAGAARFGSLKVREGKSKNAQRNLSLTSRASAVLSARRKQSASAYVFPGEYKADQNRDMKLQKQTQLIGAQIDDTKLKRPMDAPMLVTSLDHLHRRVCEPVVDGKKQVLFPREFVLHGLRHTFLTRLGEAGADAFTIMKLAGHSSVTVSQRYVHPTPESCELAFERLEALNARESVRAEGKESLQKSLQSLDDSA